jgi:hypothetical protein
MWFGSLVEGDVQGKEGGCLAVEWQEQAAAFGHWAYCGKITPDGRHINGTFHLSVLPRKKGTFHLSVLDPEPPNGNTPALHWFYDECPTARQLSGRVMLKWLKKRQDKREGRITD